MKRVTLCAALLLSLPAVAQTESSAITAPPLDVVSVKQNNIDDPQNGQLGLRADGIYTTNTSLRFMMDVAFRRKFSKEHIVGVPEWWQTDRFDVVGKVAEADLPKLHGLNREQYEAMRSGLLLEALTDRFHLKTHVEEREGPVYALIVAKGGPKMKKVSEEAPRDLPGGSFSLTAIHGKIEGHLVPMHRLVEALMSEGQLDRVVVDRTGLTGVYDLDLEWLPDQAEPNSPDTNLPSLLTAIQEQLGLKLGPAKGPIKTLVVDHVEKPASN